MSNTYLKIPDCEPSASCTPTEFPIKFEDNLTKKVTQDIYLSTMDGGRFKFHYLSYGFVDLIYVVDSEDNNLIMKSYEIPGGDYDMLVSRSNALYAYAYYLNMADYFDE